MPKVTIPNARFKKTSSTSRPSVEGESKKHLPPLLSRAEEIQVVQTMQEAKGHLMKVLLRSRLGVCWIAETDVRKSGIDLDKADQLAVRKLIQRADEHFEQVQSGRCPNAAEALGSLLEEISGHLAHRKFQYARMDGLFEELHRIKGHLKPVRNGIQMGEMSSVETLCSLEKQLWIPDAELDSFFATLKKWETAFLGARSRLVEANLRLVPFCANRFRESRMAFEDLVQEGCVAVTLALENYDPSRSKFSTFATKVIVSSMIRAIDDQASLIRIPVHACEKIRKIRKLAEALGKDLNRDATDAEIAKAANLDTDKVRELRAASQAPLSLDSPFHIVEEPDADKPSEAGETQHAHLANDATEKTSAEVLARLARLSPVEREVVERIYGLGNFEAFSEVEAARSLNRTPAQVREILARALKTMAGKEKPAKHQQAATEMDMIGVAA